MTVKQTQAKEENGKLKDLFNLKVPLGFGYIKDNEKPAFKTFYLKVNQTEQVFYFFLTEKPDFISFDIGNYHLKTVDLEYGFSELKAQLTHDPDVISRIYAAIAMGKKGNLEAVKALKEALENEMFWGLKVEIAKELGKIKLNQATQALIAHINNHDARVRRAIVEALTHHKTIASYQALKNIAINGDDSYYVESSAIEGLGKLVTGTLEAKQ